MIKRAVFVGPFSLVFIKQSCLLSFMASEEDSRIPLKARGNRMDEEIERARNSLFSVRPPLGKKVTSKVQAKMDKDRKEAQDEYIARIASQYIQR